MKITIEIADEDIRAALITAAEQGIGYWAAKLSGRKSVYSWKARQKVWVCCKELVQVSDSEQRLNFLLDIERGLRLMLTRRYHIDGSPRAWDADEADAFVQYAAFGKLVYG